ncbi:ATP-dependent Clp protease proteolytic subunit [Pontivivens insulae]|uniref:ATP-dependent Clp protease proteolytic subunit n=1 Tax=Pontivivens insulae TaxID=1639689 RepID=A0A2R8AB92_9RHOB|nr:ATP-dependent Clp protease proteolytic subunit [Pontivivens insulae]RED13256.1 ATP-dependent Clp protease proteolytic subunit ClpP [Pontivivens insulae]SPF29348.1 ATP-dependent Clp protease proteolytic subunit [Pontivivens insulae]
MSDNEDKKTDAEQANPMIERMLKARQVLICEAINQDMAKRVTAQLLMMANDSDDDITLFLNSQGGHVEAGDTIHDIIKFIKPRVKIVGTGWVASAGTHIFLAADKEDRVCLPNTRFLIHQPSGGVGGQVTDIAIQAQQIEKMRARLARVIADATGQPFERVMEDIDRDHWMDTQEAIEYGILSRVVSSSADL